MKVDVFLMEIVLEDSGAFVVEPLELGFQSGGTEAFVETLVGLKESSGLSIWEGLRKDVVAIVVV